MELKLTIDDLADDISYLLIVPYGIETYFGGCRKGRWYLLIVPYGIETRKATAPQLFRPLLIVPYGIETGTGTVTVYELKAFNRTLWN